MIPRPIIMVLMAAIIAACGEPPANVAIRFAPVFGTRSLACADDDSVPKLTDLRFYVSDIKLITVAGEPVDLQLEPDGLWQQDDLALLDFENGAGACENGTTATNVDLRGRAKAADYRGLQFTIGVPFERNHADPLQAEAPLGDASMHWHWRAGYKFFRAGVRMPDDGFWIHLGSTGCQGTVRNITACHAPNRVFVRLDGFVPGEDVVEIDLGALVTSADLEDNVKTNCSSSPAETSCDGPFRAFGLELASGVADKQQRVFRRQASK